MGGGKSTWEKGKRRRKKKEALLILATSKTRFPKKRETISLFCQQEEEEDFKRLFWCQLCPVFLPSFLSLFIFYPLRVIDKEPTGRWSSWSRHKIGENEFKIGKASSHKEKRENLMRWRSYLIIIIIFRNFPESVVFFLGAFTSFCQEEHRKWNFFVFSSTIIHWFMWAKLHTSDSSVLFLCFFFF